MDFAQFSSENEVGIATSSDGWETSNMNIPDRVLIKKQKKVSGFAAGIILATVCSLLVVPAALAATTDTWTGGVAPNDYWSANGNWGFSSGSGPVGSGDTLIFGTTGSATLLRLA